MNYRHLSLHCQCGEVPEQIAEVGFTDDHMLVVHWWCVECQQVVYVTKPLAECWRDCPSPNYSLDLILPATVPQAVEEQDADFLRSIGVQV